MKRLYILEGPDGGGKTTLGAEMAGRLDIPEVTNHGPYLGEQNIWKHYFDSMLPAYSGARDVILDRSWIAEPIYGQVMRGGMNRLQFWQLRILEYVARECAASVIWCLPPLGRCLETFRGRLESEYPKKELELQTIYQLYDEGYRRARSAYGHVSHFRYDFTSRHSREELMLEFPEVFQP